MNSEYLSKLVEGSASPPNYEVFDKAFEQTEQDISGVATTLNENHQDVMLFRNKIYSEFRLSTPHPTDRQRLLPIAKVVNFAFTNIDPEPNKKSTYIKDTDIKHFKEISYLSARYWTKQYPSTSVPLTLIVAGWFHDIERFIPQTRREEIKEEKVNEHNQKVLKTVKCFSKKLLITSIAA